MRKAIFGIFILFGLVVCFSQGGYTKGFELQVGENLQYKVMVKSLFHGANQYIKVVSEEKYGERRAYRVISRLDTHGVVGKLFNYSETEEIILDAEGLYPLYLERLVEDGSEVEQEKVHFDYDKSLAVRSFFKEGEAPQQVELALPGKVYDGLALQFFLRTQQPQAGKNQLYFYSNGKIKEVSYQVKQGGADEINLDCGTYDDYYQIEGEGLSVMISADVNRYPLLIRKSAAFGEVKMQLVSFAN